MNHPFEQLSPNSRKGLFWIAFVASLILIAVFGVIGEPLITPAAPSGIVSFELAGNPANAQAMLDSWDESARLYAAFGLGIDYLFMVAYSTAIALGCVWAARVLQRSNWPLIWLGNILAWGQGLAGILDGVENAALSVVLLKVPASPWPELAYWCASIKFSLIFFGLVYTFLGLAIVIVERIKVQQK